MRGWKNILSLGLGLGLLIYAVPRLQVGQGWHLPTIFAVVWLGMLLLVVGAHLHELIGVDEGQRAEAERIKRYRRWQMERRLSGLKAGKSE